MNKTEFLNVFQVYASKYDLTDPKILLKYIHTEKVAENSERIARSLNLSESEIELAWQIGVLHDVGRFEQLRRYDTFNDAASIDHAQFGADLLFREGLIERFFPKSELAILEIDCDITKEADCNNVNSCIAEAENIIHIDQMQEKNITFLEKLAIIETAIRCHNLYRLPEGLSEYETLFCNIIRDADKADIFRANYETGMDAIYNVTMQELKESEITPAVYEAFMEGHAVLRSLKKHPIDHLVGHLALSFEFVFAETGKIAAEQGFLWKLAEFHSDNPETEQKMERIRGILKERIANLK